MEKSSFRSGSEISDADLSASSPMASSPVTSGSGSSAGGTGSGGTDEACGRGERARRRDGAGRRAGKCVVSGVKVEALVSGAVRVRVRWVAMNAGVGQSADMVGDRDELVEAGGCGCGCGTNGARGTK